MKLQPLEYAAIVIPLAGWEAIAAAVARDDELEAVAAVDEARVEHITVTPHIGPAPAEPARIVPVVASRPGLACGSLGR